MEWLLRRKYLIIGIGCVSLLAIVTIFSLAGGGLIGFRLWQMEWTPQGRTFLRYDAAALDFSHEADLENSLPFMASAAVDLDGDGRDELFLGGGKGQDDAIFAFIDGAFKNISADYQLRKGENDATMGVAAIDLDRNGLTDLLAARESGVWLHRNLADGMTSERLDLGLAENTTPLSIALGDVNRDGWVDFYISGYLKKALVEGETIFSDGYGGYSYLFINNGDNSWRNASEEASVFRQHNTFAAVFADLDNDADSDLVIAQDTGRVEMYENTGALPMRPIENPSVNSYPMGVAAGDYDNDGLVDLYFSNVGYTLPPAMLRGDLPEEAQFNPEYMLFKNEGGLHFKDVSRAAQAAKYGFGWGVVFADMNLDGHEDILAAQNYARFPANEILERYPGKLLNYNSARRRFEPVERIADAENPNFGIAPIVSDFNLDGWPDLVWANLDGPSLAYICRGGSNGWLKVRLPNDARSLNAIVTLTLGDGTVLTKQLIANQGLGSDQSRALIFGLGANGAPQSLSVAFQNGETVSVRDVQRGATIDVVLEAAAP